MITVRKATLQDSTAIAACLFLAMEDIIYQFIGVEDQGKGRNFILHFVQRENNQYSYQNCWVAQNDIEVVAAVNIYDGADLFRLRQPVADYLKQRFNNNRKLEVETQPGEYYIDSLGVRTEQQGKGIGTALLQFVINEYVLKTGQTLGLLVDEKNVQAKKLYERLGFISRGKKILFGKNMEHLQMKSLPASN